jgi:chemotaxis signal transduction protein
VESSRRSTPEQAIGLALPAPTADSAAADAPRDTARLLVVERPGGEAADRWVCGVDEVAGVHRVTAGMLRAVPSTVGHAGGRLSSALFAWQERTVALLDEARLFEALQERIAG